jgi:hypothetical protein
MNRWTLKVVLMTASVLLLTACPKKGGKSAAAPAPGAGGVCTIGPTGGCVGQVAYNGSGRWNGTLNVAPGQIQLYRQFLIENGLCYGYQCNQPTNFVGVSIRLNGGQARVSITPYEFNGWSRNRLSRNAHVTSVNNVSSFNMVLIDPNQYYTQIGQQAMAAPVNTIQLANAFTTAYGDVITTTLFYRNVPIASGQLQGRRSQYGYGGQPQPVPYGGQPAPGVTPYYR